MSNIVKKFTNNFNTVKILTNRFGTIVFQIVTLRCFS